MADEVTNEIIQQDAPTTQPQQPPSGNFAPGLDQELDDALNKAFTEPEPKVESKPKAPPEAPTPEINKDKKPVTQEPVAKKESQSLPDPDSIPKDPPGKSSRAGWDALKNNYREAHKISQQKDEEIVKLKATLAEKGTVSLKEVETLKSQVEELSKYRAMVDIQADPEFVSKYDQPIESAVNSIKDILTSLNVTPELISQIDFTNTKIMDEIIGHVGANADKFVARKLERKVEELVSLSEKKDETLKEQTKNYKQILEEKKKQSFSKGAEEEGKIIKHLEFVANAKDKEGKDMFPFLKKMEVTDNLSPLQVEQINNHNNLVEAVHKRVAGVLKMNTPEERAEVAVAAVSASYLSSKLRFSEEKVRKLEEEIKKISNVSTETEKTKPNTSRRGADTNMSVDEALSAHFSQR